MSGLRSDYLQKIGEDNIKDFKEVLPCDFFREKEIGPNESYICNLSNSKSKGSHFVAIRFKEGKAMYFDSFGVKCMNLDILYKFKSLGIEEIVYSTKCLQSFSSQFCGFFCISMLLYTETNSLEDYLRIFDKNDLHKNDRICINIIKEHLKWSEINKKCHTIYDSSVPLIAFWQDRQAQEKLSWFTSKNVSNVFVDVSSAVFFPDCWRKERFFLTRLLNSLSFSTLINNP